MAREINLKRQVIYSEPRKLLVGNYLTSKGKRLLKEGIVSEDDINAKYRKNKYKSNPNAYPVNVITHSEDHYKRR